MVAVVNKFNRGEVAPEALARDDVTPVNNSCELMENFLPVRLGPMRFRPGFEYVGDAYSPTSDTSRALIPLTRSIGDSVQFEFSGTTMRPLVDGLPVTVSADTTSLTNEDFAASLTGWTLDGMVSWDSRYGGSATVGAGAQQGIYQASGVITANEKQTFYIKVEEGPCYLTIGEGSTYKADDLVSTMLYPGEHWVQFTPTTNQFVISFFTTFADFGDGESYFILAECSGQTSGVVSFTVPQLDYRVQSFDASADVMFLALGADNAPRIVRRFGVDSYFFEEYLFFMGPFQSLQTSDVKLEASVQTGQSNALADSALFDASIHVGRLVKIAQIDYTDRKTFTSVTSSDGVGVRGFGRDREVLVEFTSNATWSGTVVLERWPANDTPGNAKTVRTFSGQGAAESVTVADKHDGELYYYRFRCTAYSAGSATCNASVVSQANYGHGRIVSLVSSTIAVVNTYTNWMYPQASVTHSPYWYMGAWGPGSYPQGVTFYEGRLCWVSKNRVDMTVTDDYYSFDTDIPGASAAVSRTIGFGPVEDISWVESGDRLFIGLPTTEVLVRSSGFDEPLTNLNTNLKPGKGVGSKAVRAVADEDDIYFVSRDGKRASRLSHTISDDKQLSEDLMMLHPDICADGIAAMAITKHPEKRIWVLTETGELRVLLKEPTENIQAWCRVTVDGVVEDIQVVPQTGEDELWAIIRRNGNSRLYKLTKFSETAPVDFCVRYTSPGTATLTGLSHLEGETVHVWADGQFLTNTYTVSSGQITVDSAAYTTVFVGKQITAKYTSNKLGQYSAQTVLGERFRVTRTAIIMKDYAPGSLQLGRDYSNLHDLPNAVAGPLVTDYDEQMFSFGGTLDTNSRICLQATGPCTIMALAFDVNVPKAQRTDG